MNARFGLCVMLELRQGIREGYLDLSLSEAFQEINAYIQLKHIEVGRGPWWQVMPNCASLLELMDRTYGYINVPVHI